MTHGSLFSGIGGFDLAAQWMGWENKFHCEWNEFGQKVLHHYWPETELFKDITKSDFTKYHGTIDIISGGFPCQPYSMAGKRLGKEDDRHLWPEMLRVIREVRPRWVVGENVLGLVNWNGGLVFHEVQTDLEAEGYEVQPYVLPAAAVGAPHRRDRVWFVAYAKSARAGENIGRIRSVPERCDKWKENESFVAHSKESRGSISKLGKSEIRQQVQAWRNIDRFENMGDATNTGLHTNGLSAERGMDMGGELLAGRERKEKADGFNIHNKDAADTDLHGRNERHREYEKQSGKRGVNALNDTFKVFDRWERFPTESPICSRNDGISTGLDNITFSKWRNESIKAYGNAVVPQVVYQIFKAIQEYENKYL